MANNQKRGPSIPNIEAFLAIGMDPKTGLPLKFFSEDDTKLKDEIKRMLRITDEQDSIGRYEWNDLPPEIDPDLLERIIYYRGQGAFFKLEDKYFFLPYALDGGIDVYGRFNGITPLPFNGTVEEIDKKKAWVPGLVFEPIYQPFDEETYKMAKDLAQIRKCVLLKDYTEQMPETVISRQILDEGIIDMMSNCIPYMNTALIRSTGVGAIRVGNPDEQSNIAAANRAMKQAALGGKPYIPVVGAIDWQSLNEGATAKAEEFMQAMQSLDNFRLATKGLDNGGVYEKKAHKLESEQEQANTNCSLVMDDGLRQRQKFADRVNSLYDLNISCQVRETEDQMALSSGDDGAEGDTTINNEGGAQNE